MIHFSYREIGSRITKDSLEESSLEREIGKISDTWNVGLFRFLDEALYLVSNLQSLALADMLESGASSLTILLHQIEKNVLAVRTLLASGLDGPARQNLRALLEMCQAFCRFQVDSEFREEFGKQSNFEEANRFWHRFISRQKTERFLERFNKENQHKCLLITGDSWKRAHQILGVGTHPNYLGWLMDLGADFREFRTTGQVNSNTPERATEFSLSTCCHIIFLTINFVAPFIAGSLQNRKFSLTEIDVFHHHKDGKEAVEAVGRVALLLFVMIMKWTDQNRPVPDQDTNS